MSDESEVGRVLSNAEKLKFLGPNRAFITLLFALWAARRRAGLWSVLMKLGLIAGGASGYGYLTGFFI